MCLFPNQVFLEDLLFPVGARDLAWCAGNVFMHAHNPFRGNIQNEGTVAPLVSNLSLHELCDNVWERIYACRAKRKINRNGKVARYYVSDGQH